MQAEHQAAFNIHLGFCQLTASQSPESGHYLTRSEDSVACPGTQSLSGSFSWPREGRQARSHCCPAVGLSSPRFLPFLSSKRTGVQKRCECYGICSRRHSQLGTHPPNEIWVKPTQTRRDLPVALQPPSYMARLPGKGNGDKKPKMPKGGPGGCWATGGLSPSSSIPLFIYSCAQYLNTSRMPALQTWQ